MTDEDKNHSSRSNSAKFSKYPKDGWDKAEIVFKFLGGIVAAFLIGGIALWGNNYLQDKNEADSNIKLYTQLLSDKEASENSLRKDMFSQILLSFVSPNDTRHETKQSPLVRIREMRLSLELLSRNFHESLDMKPLFKHLLMEIIRPMSPIKRCSRDVGKINEQLTEEAIENCRKAARKLNEDLKVDDLAKGKKDAIDNMYRVVRQYDRELDQLISAAKRVTRKQREVLEEVSGKLTLTIPIPLKEEEPRDVCIAYSPIDWLPKDTDKCEMKLPGKGVSVFEVNGVKEDGILTFKKADGGADEASTRYFHMKVRYIYPRWKQVFVEIFTCRGQKACEDAPAKDKASFWLEYFDFPQVDSTYLNSKERYSVILEGFEEWPDGREKSAEITLLYYPAAYSGLKEKSFYNNQMMRVLLESPLFNKESTLD